MFLSLLISTLLLNVLKVSSISSSKEKVLLSNVQVLTFYQDSFTTGRRTSSRRQIECRSGCHSFFPEEIQCYNRGSDGIDVNWECQSNLPSGLRLSNVVVGCEGYDYPDDPYILAGSCQVTVTLNGDETWRHQQNSRPYDINPGAASGGSTSIWSIITFLVFMYLLYKIFQFFLSQSVGAGIGQQQQQYYYPQPTPTGWGFWPNFGLGALFGSMFANRGGYSAFSPYFGRRPGAWGYGASPSYYQGYNRTVPSAPSPSSRRRETQTSFARTERR